MVKNKTGSNRYFLWGFFTILLLGALSGLTGGAGSAAPAESLPVITVSTPEEFMKAIGPDRIIRIEAEVLQLPNEKVRFTNDYITQEEVIDGYQLLIHNVANLTITGAGEKPVRILSEPVYGYVLGFRNAEKIRIQSVEAGHIPGTRECVMGVLYFENCREIEIDRSILFGCGFEGVELLEVDGFLMKDSVIRECVSGIMTIKKSRNCLFTNSAFLENQGWHMIRIKDAANIRFSGCRIEGNIAYNNEHSSIFDVSTSEEVVVEDCLVENNTVARFTYRGTGLTVKDTTVENNRFHQVASGNIEEDNDSAAPTSPYAEYSINLEYLMGLYVDSLLNGTDNTARMEKIYTEMVEVLLELERTQGNNDIELDLLLGVYHTIGYQAGIISNMRLAEERFQNVLRKDPHSLPGYYGLAELYFTDCIFEELAFNKDESFVAYYRKKTDAEMMEKALVAYLDVLRLKDQNIENLAPADHYRIITLFFFTGKADKALEYARQLAALNPEQYGKCLEIVEELGKENELPWRIEFPLMLMY